MVLLVALQVLNVSIDVDHVRNPPHHTNRDKFDDVDSFVELIAELITGDDNFLVKHNKDDHNPGHKISMKFVGAIEFYSPRSQTVPAPPAESKNRSKFHPRNSEIPFQDFSELYPKPPRLA